VTIHQRLPWLQRIVLCLGIMGFCSLVVWGQTSPSKAVEEARKKRLQAEIDAKKAEIEERRAALNDRHELELQVLSAEEQLITEQLNLNEKRKQKEELERRRDGLVSPKRNDNPYNAPQLQLQPGGVPQITPYLPEGIKATAASPNQLEGAFLDRKVHVLIYANTADGAIGNGCEANRRYLTSLLQHQLKTRFVSAAITPQFSARSILNDIDRLNVSPADAVFVHISTHGAFFNGEHMLSDFGSAQVGNGVGTQRRMIMEHLKTKTAGADNLRVLITDSCATILGQRPFIPGEEAPERETHELFRLLMTTTGEVSVNAAGPDTQALYFSVLPPQGGGIFTRAFLLASVYGGSGRTATGTAQDWLPFFTEVSRYSQSTRTAGQQQPPACWFSNDGKIFVLK